MAGGRSGAGAVQQAGRTLALAYAQVVDRRRARRGAGRKRLGGMLE